MENGSLKVLYEELLKIKQHIGTIVDQASAQGIGDDYVGVVVSISDAVNSTIKSVKSDWLESHVKYLEFPGDAESEWSYDVVVIASGGEYSVSFAKLDQAREYAAELLVDGDAMRAIIKIGWKMPLYDCRPA
jgi:hypothetical protein